MSWETPLSLKYPFEGARAHLLDPGLFRRWWDGLSIDPAQLGIADFEPADAYAGTAMVITGSEFSPVRADNQVMVGGMPALVVEASPTRLFVLTDPQCKTGPVEVTVGGDSTTANGDFVVRPWPAPGSLDPAPPYSFTGRGRPGSYPGGAPVPGSGPVPGGASAGSIPPTGTAQVLVILTYPTDKVPANTAQLKTDVENTFDTVTTYYKQVSYNTLDVQVTVTDAIALLDDADYYHRPNGSPGYPNIDGDVIGQLTAEAAQGAVDQGIDLDDFSVMAVLVHMPGLGVRAWGGWTQQNFTYNDGAGTAISLTAANPLSMIVARHDADWGRAAHEFGHNLIDGGLVLGEDIYGSDLVDPTQATAQQFDMMGDHDSHPLYSGLFMNQLQYYGAANVLELQWNRNPFQQDYLVVAHGDALDSTANRYNLIRIKVSPGLDYFVEVRQRPPAGSGQVYDTNIPLPGGTTRTGGVIVSKAITDVVNNNQQMRLVSLLHDPAVLLTNGVATDPLRSLTVTVLDDQVSTNPLVCKVRVEWAQQIGDTPGGDFDLSITPWGPGYESVDIWVDRDPFGVFDFTDGSGNPTGNGDEPRPLEVNRFTARVHNSGIAANNVRMTFYSITPPGVGDNGTWTPLQTKIVAVGANTETSTFVNWIPTVGEHTCLKVIAEPQFGEISVGNNSAQENVFNFQPAANSVPEPVSMLVAIRNPLDHDADVHVRVVGVPDGYRVYLPHRWVRLPAFGEMHMDLLVVPLHDLEELRAVIMRVGKEGKRYGIDPAPRIRVYGQVERGYTTPLGSGEIAGSWYLGIGGVAARVEPKRMGDIKLGEDDRFRDHPRAVGVRGSVNPAAAGQSVRVDLSGSDGTRESAMATTDSSGSFAAVFGLDDRPPHTRDVGLTRLGLDPNVLRRPGLPRLTGRVAELRRDQSTTYQVQAHILNAADVAPASSNVVKVSRKAASA